MSEIINNLVKIEEQERKIAIEKALALEKAFSSKDADTIVKAQNYYNQFMQRQQPTRNDGMKSMVIDPFEINASMGYYGKNAMISYEALRAMSRAPIPRACINTRKDQVAEFCKPQPDKYSKGFTFVKKGISDVDDLSDRDKKVIEKLTSFILNCGDQSNKWDLDDFETFIRKIVEDSLVYDQLNAEIIPNKRSIVTNVFEPTQFVAVDASTFRIADSYDNDNNIEDKQKINGYYPSYVQLYQGQIVADFYPWELTWGIRNPSTNIRQNGYGRSELEDMITIVTSMLNADRYNGNFFTRGSAPKGMLMVKKSQGLNKDRIAEFRRDWQAMLGGVENSWKTPILDAESFEWLDLQKNNRDMEFSKYQEYLVKLCCALYKISPEEIGFPLEGAGKSSLNSDSGKAEKDYSLSKGLKPLLTFIQNIINKYIIGPKTNYLYEFKFVGIEAESARDEEERLQKAVTLYLTPDEVRKDKGLKPLPGGIGKMPLNPIFAQMKLQESEQINQEKDKKEEKDNQDNGNTNPFLDSEEDDDNPFMKSFNAFLEEELILK